MKHSTELVAPPIEIAPETFLIPNLAPAGDVFVPVNSLVIRGDEPVVVDTGAPIHRQRWMEQVFGLVDPDDIRWCSSRTRTVTTPAASTTSSRRLPKRGW
jgi:hypothetical protein